MDRTARLPLLAAALALLGTVLVPALTCAAQTYTFAGLFKITVITTQTEGITINPILINTSLGVDAYTATLDLTLTDTVFDTLRAGVSGPLGPLSLNSTLSFNPSTLGFVSWQTGVTFSILELSFSDVHFVTKPKSSSYNQFTVSGSIGDASFKASTKLGICPLAYWESSVCVDWPWACCETKLSACVQVTDTAGVSSLDVTLSDYTIFESLLGTRWGLDVALTYTPDEKTLSPTLKFSPNWFLCADIEVLGEISAGPDIASVAGIEILGIRGECAFGECLSLFFGESLDAAKNGTVTGKSDYFGVIGISGCFPSCCGSDGAFEIATYFDPTFGALFDLALVAGSLEFQLGRTISVSIDAEVPISGGWSITSTWSVAW